MVAAILILVTIILYVTVATLSRLDFQKYNKCFQSRLGIPQLRQLEIVWRRVTVVPGLSKFLQRGERVRIMVVGNSAAGKSATGNTLLSRSKKEDPVFQESQDCNSQTNIWQVLTSNDKVLKVMDTPGFFGSNLDLKKIAEAIAEALLELDPGPSVNLYVIKIGDIYTKRNFDAFLFLKYLLGDDVTNHMIVTFTHADQLKKPTIEEYAKENKDLQEVLRQCGNRYVALDNRKDGRNREQLVELSELVKGITADSMERTGRPYYIFPHFKELANEMKKELMRSMRIRLWESEGLHDKRGMKQHLDITRWKFICDKIQVKVETLWRQWRN